MIIIKKVFLHNYTNHNHKHNVIILNKYDNNKIIQNDWIIIIGIMIIFLIIRNTNDKIKNDNLINIIWCIQMMRNNKNNWNKQF